MNVDLNITQIGIFSLLHIAYMRILLLIIVIGILFFSGHFLKIQIPRAVCPKLFLLNPSYLATYLLTYGSRKKNFFSSGLATKRGEGGVRAWPLRNKYFFVFYIV